MNWFNCRLVTYGFLLGTAGVKLLSGRCAKKVYTHVTAAALRCYDDAAEAYEILKENCGDILEGAKEINREISAEKEAEMIEDAKAVLASAEEKA